jgi:hypothetical protein
MKSQFIGGKNGIKLNRSMTAYRWGGSYHEIDAIVSMDLYQRDEELFDKVKETFVAYRTGS